MDGGLGTSVARNLGPRSAPRAPTPPRSATDPRPSPRTPWPGASPPGSPSGNGPLWKHLSQSSPSSWNCHDWPTPNIAFHEEDIYVAEEVMVVADDGARPRRPQPPYSGQYPSPLGPSPGRAAVRGRASPALVPDCKKCPKIEHLTGLFALEHPLMRNNHPEMPVSWGTFCAIGLR